jgi:spore coat polysaccharide biosynthesis protein SpsF
MTKTILIIQARNNSSRLPGKVSKKIGDKTTLEYLLERIKNCKNVDEIVLATTATQIDDSICEVCKNNLVKYYRGDEYNVLDRYYKTAIEYNASIIIRVTGDCPLIDPLIIDQMLDYFKKSNCDFMDPIYYGNGKGAHAGFPDGTNPEIFTMNALTLSQKNAILSYDKEHVTGYMIKNLNCKKFEILIDTTIYKNIDFTTLHLSLDTNDDYMLISKIINNLYANNKNFTIYDVLYFLNEL